MSFEAAAPIADVVLPEGYALHPELEDNPAVAPHSAARPIEARRATPMNLIERLSSEELMRLHGAVRDPARQEELGVSRPRQ